MAVSFVDFAKNKLGIAPTMPTPSDSVFDPNADFTGVSIPDAKELFERVDRYEVRKAPMIRDWKEALAFQAGDQWIAFKSSTAAVGNFIELPISKTGPTRMVVNFYMRNALAIVGLLTSGRPIPQCLPIGTSASDQEKARATDALIGHIWRNVRFQSTLEDMVLWAVLTGNGFLKVYWDHDAGDYELNPDTQTGEFAGQLRIDSVMPFSIGFDDAAPSFADSSWLYQRSLYDPATIEERFGKTVKADAYPEDIRNGGVLRYDVTKRSGDASCVAVVEWWQKPCKKYPRGLHIITTKQTPLYIGEWPKGTPWPIYHYRFFTAPGTPWGTTPQKQYIPIQRLCNRIISDLADHVSTSGNPAIMAAAGQQGNHKWSIGPGKIIEYDVVQGASEPHTVQLTPLADWTMNLLNTALGWGETVAGVPAAFVGSTGDGSPESGRAISYKVERASRNFANAATRLVDMINDVGIAALELYRRHGPEKETIRVMGNEGAAGYMEFTKEQISYRTLQLDESSVLVGSPQAMNDMLERWAPLGVFDPKELRRLMTMPGKRLSDLDSDADDKAWARRNVQFLKVGIEPPLMKHMNFSAHYEVVAGYMKTPEFFDLNDQIQGMFVDYLSQIETAMNPQVQPAADGSTGLMPDENATAMSPDGGGGTPSSSPATGSASVAQAGTPGQGGPGVDAEEESLQRTKM